MCSYEGETVLYRWRGGRDIPMNKSFSPKWIAQKGKPGQNPQTCNLNEIAERCIRTMKLMSQFGRSCIQFRVPNMLV